MKGPERDIPDVVLLRTVEAFLVETKMTPSGFGETVLKDHKLVFQLREGRELRRKSRERVLAFMARTRDSVVAAVPAEKVA